MLDGRFDDEYLYEIERSSQFKQEYEMRKNKQVNLYEAFVSEHSVGICVLLLPFCMFLVMPSLLYGDFLILLGSRSGCDNRRFGHFEMNSC